MNNLLMQKLLFAQTQAGKEVQITVTGISMNPTLYEGDVITIFAQKNYEVGDVLVFTYKQGELLVHRLLIKKDGKYFCKGDNSFRLEDIIWEQIIGKVIAVRRDNKTSPFLPCSRRLIILSSLVNRNFFKCQYNIEKTKQTEIYKLYERAILGKEENIMIYKKNENMDYIQTDDTSLAVFDPESGDTHFFDDIGIDILNILSEPCDIDMILKQLCEIYDATPSDIHSDVEEFLNYTIQKKVVELL